MSYSKGPFAYKNGVGRTYEKCNNRWYSISNVAECLIHLAKDYSEPGQIVLNKTEKTRLVRLSRPVQLAMKMLEKGRPEAWEQYNRSTPRDQSFRELLNEMAMSFSEMKAKQGSHPKKNSLAVQVGLGNLPYYMVLVYTMGKDGFMNKSIRLERNGQPVEEFSLTKIASDLGVSDEIVEDDYIKARFETLIIECMVWRQMGCPNAIMWSTKHSNIDAPKKDDTGYDSVCWGIKGMHCDHFPGVYDDVSTRFMPQILPSSTFCLYGGVQEDFVVPRFLNNGVYYKFEKFRSRIEREPMYDLFMNRDIPDLFDSESPSYTSHAEGYGCDGEIEETFTSIFKRNGEVPRLQMRKDKKPPDPKIMRRKKITKEFKKSSPSLQARRKFLRQRNIILYESCKALWKIGATESTKMTEEEAGETGIYRREMRDKEGADSSDDESDSNWQDVDDSSDEDLY